MTNEHQPIHHLLVIEDNQGKRTVALESATCSLGRDPTNSIVLHSKMVSRHHATLLRVTTPETASYLFRLIDGNLQGKRSTNGILVNNQRCFSYNLKHGDVIVFGSDVKARYYTSANQADVEFLTSGEVEDMSGFLSNLSNPFQTFVGSDKELEQFNEAALVRLASFPELISHPILEINLAGSITYLNPAAVLQFPDIREAGLAHPMLAGLLSKVQQDKKNYLVREVAVGQQVFEQSVHYIAQSDLIRCYVGDITERKRAEEALRGSEAKNRALLNAIPDLMLRIRQDGTYLDYMPAKGIDLLAAGNDLVGKNEYEVLPPAVATARMSHVERALQTSETQVFEYQLPRNGSIRHEEARIVVSGENEVLVIVRDITKRKQVEAALQQAHDELELRVAQRTAELSKANEQLRKEITERQWAEEAMRQSEERLKAVLDNSTALIYVKDTQGRYLLINHWYARLFHLDQEAIRGKTDYDIFPKELADVYQANDQSVLKAGRSLEYEEVAPQDDGLHTYLSIKFPLYDTAGVPSAVCGISTDITQRKQTEAALRSSVATNRALLNAIPDLMVRISKDGTLVNFKVPKDINLASADQLLGKNLYEVLPLEVARSAAHCVESALETNDIQIFEYQLPQQFQLQGNSATHEKAPQWRDYEARVVVSAKDEVLAIVRDITERKQAEEEVRNALEKEKELSELKSRFVTMTSHEFRTPLTTILSSAELLENYSYKWSEEKKLSHLYRIQAAVKHMTQLLNDVLLIGKAEAGRLEFKPAPLDLLKFCHDVVEEMQLSTRRHTVTFSNQGDCDTAWMDEKLLRHILSNLLSNAIKYSPQGGTVRFDLICQQGEAIFHIQDQGIGIPRSDQAQLFDAFHRASNVGTISGTGLGLAIVKQSVDIYGGRISVASEAGAGTRFTVTLPINKQV